MSDPHHGYTRAYIDRDAFDRAKGQPGDPIPFVAANEGLQGDGIDLRMDGADLRRFKTNPVIGYGHSYWGRINLPIGRASNIRTDGTALRMDIAFDQADDFATTVERKYRDKFLNAVSIGFDVTEWEDPKTQGYWTGGVAVKWELFETSAVPIPMDPKALAEARSRGADGDTLTDAIRALFDRLGPDLGEQIRAALLDRSGAPAPQREDIPQPPAADAPALTRLAVAQRRLRLAGLGI